MVTTEIEVAGIRAVVAHDPLPADAAALQTDIVVGPGGATWSLLGLTPRRHVKRVWDLGCGSGALAVVAAQHADTVIATDIDQRCLDFTDESARLSGVKVETRRGSLAEPVIGEKFDLIISNPPFVIGDQADLVHRESPFAADGLPEELLRLLPEHLEIDGLAIMLTSWLVAPDADEFDRLEAWMPDNCNVWVGLRAVQSIDDYVDTWLADAGMSDDSNARDRWLHQLEAWGADRVAFGFIVLERTTAEPWFRTENVTAAVRIPTGDELLERLAAATESEQLTAVSILSGCLVASGEQAWRGEIGLDPVLAAIRDRLDGQSSATDIADELARQWQVEADDVLVHALARRPSIG